MGRESRVDNESAARFFFDDLAESNGVPMEHRAFHTIPMPHANIFAQGRQDANLLVHAGDTRVHLCAGIGFQKQVAMGRDFDQEGNSRSHLQDLQTIRVDLVVLRLLEQETDLLITVSTPMETSELPAAFSGAVQTNAMSAVILQAVSTLKIQDWGLFA